MFCLVRGEMDTSEDKELGRCGELNIDSRWKENDVLTEKLTDCFLVCWKWTLYNKTQAVWKGDANMI